MPSFSRFTLLSLAILLIAQITACADPNPPAQPNNNSNNSDPNNNNPNNNDSNGPSPDALDADAYFSLPGTDDPDESLQHRIVDLIDDVPDDAELRGAFFSFSRVETAEALIAAHQRGVDIRLVVGNNNRFSSGSYNDAVQLLIDQLGNRVHICTSEGSEGGCIGSNIQHNKFLTISEIGDGSTDIVAQTSGNITNAQPQDFDNLVILRGDSAIFQGYRDYWSHLNDEQPSFDHAIEGDERTQAFFFPVEFSVGDVVRDLVADIDCADGGHIYVAMAFFTDARNSLAENLRDRHREGCDLSLVLGEDNSIDSPGSDITDILYTDGIEVALFPDGQRPQVHSKYMLFDGVTFQGTPDTQAVITGSHNYSFSALFNNDEAILKLKDADLTDAFVDNFEHVFNAANPVHP